MNVFNIFALAVGLAFTYISNAADFNKYAFTLEVKSRNEAGSYGTGCLLKIGNDIYYVTAHHIFGNGSEKELNELPQHSTIVNEADENLRIKPEAFIPVPDVRDLTGTDLLVLKVRTSAQLTDHTLKIASAPPQPGESVYLPARLPGKSLATYALQVLITNDKETQYAKIPNIEKYTGASGGPILNAAGDLIGTYLGRKVGKQKEIVAIFGTPFQSLVTIFEGITKTAPPSGKLTSLATPSPRFTATPGANPPMVSQVVAAKPEQDLTTNQPTPVNLKSLTAIPSGWPKSVHLKKAMDFPVVLGGKPVGTVRLPAGTEARLTAIRNGMLALEYQGGSGYYSPEETDLMDQLQASQ